eukprot:scaffold141091_cov29-Tisochrysis_lutea.AAC.4
MANGTCLVGSDCGSLLELPRARACTPVLLVVAQEMSGLLDPVLTSCWGWELCLFFWMRVVVKRSWRVLCGLASGCMRSLGGRWLRGRWAGRER